MEKYSNKAIVIVSLFFTVFLTLFYQYINYVVILTLPLLLIFMYKQKAIYLLIIISFMTLTSTINTDLRFLVQLLGIGILYFLFFKQYGLRGINYPPVPANMLKMIALLFVSISVSIIFSDYKAIGITQLVRTIIFILIVYSIYSALFNYISVQNLIFAIFFTGIVYVGFVLFKFYESGFSLIDMSLIQLKGIREEEQYINLNSMSSLLSIIILILFPYLISKIKLSKRIIIAIFLLVNFAAIIIANSRGSILSLLVGLLFIAYKHSKKLFASITGSILLFISLMFIEPFSSIINIYFRTEKLVTGRDWILETVYYATKGHLFFGVGPAATKFELYRNLPFMFGTPQELLIRRTYYMGDFGHAHNFYLFFLSDLGILGFITSILFPVVFLSMCSKLLKIYKEQNMSEYLLILGITGAGLSVFVRGLLEWGNILSYGTLGNDLPLWLLVIVISFIYVNRNNNTYNFRISFPFFQKNNII